MTMILKKDFTSFNHRLFVVPVSVRAISFKSSPSGELSYYIKKNPALQDSPPAAGCFQQHNSFPPQCDPARRDFYVIGKSEDFPIT